MVFDVGVLVAMYITVRMLELLFKPNASVHFVVKFFAVLCLINSVYCCAQLVQFIAVRQQTIPIFHDPRPGQDILKNLERQQ